MIVQTIAVIGVTLLFKLTIHGSLLTASILTGLTGLCGMCFGELTYWKPLQPRASFDFLFPPSTKIKQIVILKHYHLFSGFVVSCVTDSERNATYLALGSFLPIVMLCGKYLNFFSSHSFSGLFNLFILFFTGIIWPIEGMHVVLRTISYTLPLTLSTESLRSIMARGWEFYKPTVYIGFASTLIWIVVFLSFSIFLIKFKKG